MDALFAPGGVRAGLATSGGCGNVSEPTCDDGIQNGDETGIDCGGSNCPACPPSCDDGIQNGDETGVDCGGSCAPCVTVTCDDGIQTGDETGVDCGGSDCPACPATCDDGIQNGEETGVDCGGPDCAPCSTGGSCDTPTGTVATNIKRKRANLNWNAVDGAIDYTVQFRVAGASAWASEANTAETTINATSLSNNTTYEWQVRANCSGSSSDYSPICSFTAGDSNSSSCAGERLMESTVNAFPNPTTGDLNIQFQMERGIGYRVILLDGMGRVVNEWFTGEQVSLQVDISDVAPGLYFIQVTNGTDQEVIRIVKD